MRCAIVAGALISWYLLMPGVTDQGEIATNEPVTEWPIAVDLPTFSKSDCEQLRVEILHHLDPIFVPAAREDSDWMRTRTKLREEIGQGVLNDQRMLERVHDGVCRWLSDSFDGFDAFD